MSRTCFALVVALTSLVACGEANEADGGRSDNLFGRASVFWRRSAGQNIKLEVCWVNPGRPIIYPATPPADAETTTTEREQWVRSAIEESWQSALAVDFVGWNRCVGGEDIAIRIESGTFGSKVDTFGTAIKGRQMHLNLDAGDLWRYFQLKAQDAPGVDFWVAQGCSQFSNRFSSAHPEFAHAGTDEFRAYYRNCLAGTAVHEFGHALGFLHEQYRRDEPFLAQEKECHRIALAEWGDDVIDPATIGTASDHPLGPFDAESIMSYCRTDWTTFQPSPSDIAQASLVYGARSRPL